MVHDCSCIFIGAVHKEVNQTMNGKSLKRVQLVSCVKSFLPIQRLLSVCSKYFEKILENAKKQGNCAHCPVCYKLLSINEMASIPVNADLERYVEMYTIKDKADKNPNCNNCTEPSSPIFTYCKNCKLFLVSPAVIYMQAGRVLLHIKLKCVYNLQKRLKGCS